MSDLEKRFQRIEQLNRLWDLNDHSESKTIIENMLLDEIKLVHILIEDMKKILANISTKISTKIR